MVFLSPAFCLLGEFRLFYFVGRGGGRGAAQVPFLLFFVSLEGGGEGCGWGGVSKCFRRKPYYCYYVRGGNHLTKNNTASASSFYATEFGLEASCYFRGFFSGGSHHFWRGTPHINEQEFIYPGSTFL